MADEDKGGKPESRRKKLYDGAKKKGGDVSKEAKRGEDVGDKKKVEAAEKKGEAGEKGHPAKKEAEKPVEKPVAERHSEERHALLKQHETERRDLHGNHREEHRQMAGRHEKAIKELAERHAKELGEVPQGAGEGVKSNPPADKPTAQPGA